MIVQRCGACAGEGLVNSTRELKVEVPAGVDTGTSLKLPGRGSAGPRGGEPGDLYVHLRVRPHPLFVRDGRDLRARLPVSFSQAALGAEIELDTLRGAETIHVAAGTQSGDELRFPGQGVPDLHGGRVGDLIVSLAVETPRDLTPEQEELLRRLAELRDEPVAEPERGLRSRLKSAFRS